MKEKIIKDSKTADKAVRKEEKLKQIAKDDAKYKANEIKWGIRVKLITLFSILIFILSYGIIFQATSNQEKSLLIEKNVQAKIIIKGLTGVIKSKFLDLYASNSSKIKKLKTYKQYRKFYKNAEFNSEIFENVDSLLQQPDVVYAYILGLKDIVLSNTDTNIKSYSKYKFIHNERSFSEAYKALKEKPKNLIPLSTKINNFIIEDARLLKKFNIKPEDAKKPIEAVDYTYIISFKDHPKLKDRVGEVHIGISLEAMKEQIFMNKIQLQGLGAFAIAFGVIVAIIFATFIARPIRRMIEGMQAVSEGNFQASVIVKSKDEIGLMSKTFNIMLKGMSVLVSPEVAQVVLQGGDLTQSGEKKVVTVLFSDIRGFTTISEALTPNEVVLMLNDYMEIMTDIIIKYGGVVDKFVGDEIFAVYGAPFDHPMHPLASCATAVEMGIELNKHNQLRDEEGKPPIKIGIGVNTGDVISGAMGSSKRIDYTSIGDAVNLGARLEGTNKVYGTLAICSEFTLAIVKDDVIVRELDLIRVKGKHEPVRIFEVIDLSDSGYKKIAAFLEQLKKEKELLAAR